LPVATQLLRPVAGHDFLLLATAALLALDRGMLRCKRPVHRNHTYLDVPSFVCQEWLVVSGQGSVASVNIASRRHWPLTWGFANRPVCRIIRETPSTAARTESCDGLPSSIKKAAWARQRRR